MRRTITVALSILWSAAAFGQVKMVPGDYYIRSQSQNGNFIGYHRLLTRPEPGYVEASYCNRQFWVRKTTVLWTEKEVKAGRNLVIEVNAESARKVICQNPNKYVTLDTIGLDKREIERLRGVGAGVKTTRGRLNHISEAFMKK
ncbi:hypothetical protein [Roseibium sp.]|uniref:hypothetical protein n=1 Tax=Roseibium sp. TaxID=1936156 RepID=UPI003A9827F8